MWCVHHLPEQMKTLTLSDEKVYDFSVSIERVRYQMVGRPGAPFSSWKENKASFLFLFRFAVADQFWRSTDFGHQWFHVARVHDHSPLPVLWWCLQCQMRSSTQRPVSNSIQLQGSPRPLVSSTFLLWITCQPSSTSWVLTLRSLLLTSVWHVRCERDQVRKLRRSRNGR